MSRKVALASPPPIAGAAWWVVESTAMPQFIFRNRARVWVLMIAELGLAMFLLFRITKMSAGTAASTFLVFLLLNGLTLSSIFFVYTRGDIFQAFLTAAGMFGAMSVYGMVTKRDLTSWARSSSWGWIGVIIYKRYQHLPEVVRPRIRDLADRRVRLSRPHCV